MPRAAFLFSLLVHAVLLVTVGLKRSHQIVLDGDPGNPGVAVSFLAEQSSPAPDIASFTPAEPIPAEPTPLEPVEPVQSVPASPIQPAPSQITAAVKAPSKTAQASSAKSNPAQTRSAARARPNASGHAQGAQGSGISGNGLGYTPPRFRTRYKPPYPEAARAQRLEGTVTLRVSVDARGRVAGVGIQLSSGHAILDRAAVNSVRSWQFEPARSNGTAVAAEVELPVRFRFEERRA
ncbi:MAG: hypothetical protein JWL59_3362 [Chthoniobacteraceae bacterium]|nr:hypothetical protein [Chthoniobacteraceae bacterium]